jgi:hypothetical protein
MPTLDLITTPIHTGGSHRVLAPGGYEGWHFDASSDDGTLHLIAGLHEAYALDESYARAYARYRKRPTRVPPPLPKDFSAVTFALYQKDRQPVRFITRGTPPGEVNISSDGSRVRVGASHATRAGERGAIQLNLRGMNDGRTIAANFTFRPLIRAEVESEVIERLPGAGLHRWNPSDPMCDVDGEIAIFDGSGAPPFTIPFAGSGQHQHRYGTRPMAAASPDWLIGRALLEHRVVAFVCAGGHPATVLTALEGAPAETSRLEMPETSRIGGAARQHPDRIELADVVLEYPQVVGTSDYERVLLYAAKSTDQRGTALCRLIHPPLR